MRSEDRLRKLHDWRDGPKWPEDELPRLLPRDDRLNVLIALGFYTVLAGVFAFGMHLLGAI